METHEPGHGMDIKTDWRESCKGEEMRRGQKSTSGRLVKRKRRSRALPIALGVIFVFVIFPLVILYVKLYAPSRKHMDLGVQYKLADNEAAVIVNGAYEREEGAPPCGLYANGGYYIELSYLKEKIDDAYVYDSVEHILRYTTDRATMTAELGEKQFSIGDEKYEADQEVVITNEDGEYISLRLIQMLTDLYVAAYESPYRMVIEKAWYSKDEGKLIRSTAVRRRGGPKSEILRDVKKNDKVTVLEDYGKWSKVMTMDGVIGCVRSNTIADVKTVTRESVFSDREYAHHLLDGAVNMLWHQVTGRAANAGITELLQKAEGINVVSPTWIQITDDGGIVSLASHDYVSECHRKDVQVWALVSNFVSKVDSTKVLSRVSLRDTLVKKLIAEALTYDLDGINIDFEELKAEAKDGFIQFIRELSLACRENNLILSVDNYPPAAYNMFYNRGEQGKYADYVIVMAYDEHYAGSEEAGSTASLPFVRDAVENTLHEVSEKQVILGMPFYARVWTTSKSGEVRSKALGMQSMTDYVREHELSLEWDPTLGQNYGGYNDKEGIHQIWVEDKHSITEKLKLMTEYKLAGGAFWKEGFEPASIWKLVSEYMTGLAATEG